MEGGKAHRCAQVVPGIRHSGGKIRRPNSRLETALREEMNMAKQIESLLNGVFRYILPPRKINLPTSNRSMSIGPSSSEIPGPVTTNPRLRPTSPPFSRQIPWVRTKHRD